MRCLSIVSDKFRLNVHFFGAALIILICGCTSQSQSVLPSQISSTPPPKREEALSTVGSPASVLVAEPKPSKPQRSTPETETGIPVELNKSNIDVE
jgi:hypothetical protein